MPLNRRHLDKTREWASDPELMRLLGRDRAVSADEHERWFVALGSASDRVYMAIEDAATGSHIGNVWLWSVDARNRKAELRIVIGSPAHTDRGAGTEAIGLMCDYAFTTLELERVYAYVLAFNTRARRAFEKAGFQPEGVLREDRISNGRFVDVFVLGRLRREQARL